MLRFLTGFLVLASVFCFGFAPAGAAVAGRDFSYYQVILDKKPFGEIVLPDAAQPQTALADAVLKELEMKAIVDDGTGLRVGFLDKKTNKNFFMGVGENYDGLQLVSVNYDNEEAVVKKGAETAVIKLHPDKDKQPAAMPAVPPSVPPFAPQLAAAPAPIQSPFSFTNVSAAATGHRPFFSDLKNRRTSPFQSLGTNAAPFQAKPLDSFFKITTGVVSQAQSPFGPFQTRPGAANPGAFQQFMRGASNAPNPFLPVNPQQTAPAPGQDATMEQLPQSQPAAQTQFQPVYQEQAPVADDGSEEIVQ